MGTTTPRLRRSATPRYNSDYLEPLDKKVFCPAQVIEKGCRDVYLFLRRDLLGYLFYAIINWNSFEFVYFCKAFEVPKNMLLDINSWWAEIETFERIYWIIALPASLIFIIILITTFIAGDVDGEVGDVDADIEADSGIGFQFFSLKNLVGFFTIFAWSGIACIDAGYGTVITVGVSGLSGLLMMVVMASIFYFMGKLTYDGTLALENAIGCIGEVYLTIQPKRNGFGKVQINVQGGIRTLQAMTDDEEELASGAVVRVKEVINNQILLVAKESS